MRMNNLTIENYKCFYEKQSIELQEGFNLFIGKNNSGKTTALEIIDLPEIVNEPHKSILNSPSYGSYRSSSSNHSFKITTSIYEIKRLFGNSFVLPLPPILSTNRNISDDVLNIKQKLIDNPTIGLEYRIIGGSKKLICSSIFGESSLLGVNEVGTGINFEFIDAGDGNIQCNAGNFGSVANTLLNFSKLQAATYRFSASRSARHRFGMDSSILNRTAENLAFCINFMQTNDAEGHKQLCSLINQIFPEVRWIQSTPIDGTFELRCLPMLPHDRREDLAVPLNKMGTGIGNVIAILYVALTSRFPQIIAIDEPNSFLHPKALRELLQILSNHGKQHQYILTGHSPDVLTAIEPSTISYFEINNSSSKIREINRSQLSTLRADLSELGIRMTDLHAKDHVLWVEGQTEEILFPRLLREFCPISAAGTAILRVTNTGRFDQKKGIPADEVADAYNRLTNNCIVPPLVTILLDKETRTESELQKLLGKSKILKILPARMIENYVIDSSAIFNVLKNNGSTLDEETIAEKIPDIIDKSVFDGAAFLRTIFANSSPTTIDFKKTTHTVELFDWMLDNKPDALQELRQFIQAMFEKKL